MRTRFLAVVLALAVGLATMGLASPPEALAGNTYLRVLTINLLFSEIKDRPERLGIIADFVRSQSEPIDVILLQEVVGGSLFGTKNSAQDLRNLLAARGLGYYLNTRVEEGIPGVASEGLAFLSRHKITLSIAETLPFVEMVNFQGIKFPLRRIVALNRINIANYGPVNVYNTHLCNNCSPSGRAQQVGTVLNFIKTAEKLIPGDNPIILAGDFNIDLFFPNQRPAYNTIITNGFIDTYAAANHVGLTCCNPSSGGPCCTLAVPGNPYAIDFLSQLPEYPERLDYIFAKGKGMTPAHIVSSEVVFNSPPNWVSDHSAVLTKIRLP